MFRNHVRRVLVPVVATALALSVIAFVPFTAQTANAVPPADNLPDTVSADGLPTVQIDGVVWKQVIVGNTVYVGGQFANARPAGAAAGTNLTPRANMLAYDLNTGVLKSNFAPVFNGKVADLAVTPDGTKLIAVGMFTTVNGLPRSRVAVFDLTPANGPVLSTTIVPSTNGETNAVAATNDIIYIGGWFGAVNGTARIRVGAVRTTNGSLVTGFSVPIDDRSVQSIVISPDRQSLVLGGNFSSVGGSTSPGYGLARVNANTGAMEALPVNTEIRNAGANAGISRLAADGDSFYGVTWVYGSGGNHEGTFRANWSDGALVNLEDCHGDTYDVAAVGEVVYTASHKHYCGNSGGMPQTEPWTAWHSTAWTKSTQGTNTPDIYGYPDHPGTPRPGLLPFFPETTPGTYTGKAQAVWAVTGNNDYVLYGGEFTRVNGVVQQGIVRYAKKSSAINKQGPRPAVGFSWAPAVKSLTSGTTRVTWPALWDRDDKTLTYQVFRDLSTTKVGPEIVATNFQWDGQPMRFNDSGLTPGSSVRYAIRATDSKGNVLNSSWATTTVASGDTLGTYGNAVLNDGASKYWRLNEASGNTVSDWSGTDDTTAGTNVTRGAAGALTNSSDTASSFDGTINSSAISQQLVPGTNSFSQEVWFKTTSTAGGKIAGFGDRSTGNSSNYDRHIYMNTTGRILFGVYNGTTSTIQSGTGLNNGQWHQAVATFGPGGMGLYIDGRRVAGRTDVTTGQNYSGYWRVGGDNTWSGAQYFNGQIDEYSVYPKPLSAQQVNAHWVASGRTSTAPAAPADAQGKSVHDSNPDFYWRLNELSGTSAADAAIGVNTGTYYGTTTKGQAGIPGANRSVRLGANATVTGTFSVNNPTTFSQEVWVKTNTQVGGRIFGFGSGNTGSASSNYDRAIYMTDNGKVRFGVYNGAVVNLESTASLNDDKWHQIVTTLGESGMELYVDGQLNASNPNTVAQNYVGYWRLGGDNVWDQSTSRFFAGNVDEAAVFTKRLTLAEIQGHYLAGGGTPPANQGPTSDFTSTKADLKASFTSTSTDPDGTVDSYAWEFGDPADSKSTLANPEFTYLAPGTYQVKLTVTDNQGATGTITKPVTVTAANVKPTADFTHTKADLKASFTSTSTDSDGTVDSYAWEFGDPADSKSTLANPEFTYLAAGTYQVKLTVTDNQGATDTITKAVVVTAANVKPTADFTSTSAALTASFTSTSTDSDGTVDSYAWEFGDPADTKSTLANPDFTYLAPGTYQVKLTVTDNQGLTDTITKPVTVSAANVKPTAGFTHTKADLKASFTSTSTDSDGTVASYAWEFGDPAATKSTLANPEFTYLAAGTYQVKLTVTDNQGATDTITQPVTVTAPASNILAKDDFDRTVANLWGMAESGGAWTMRNASTRSSVGASAGRMAMPSNWTMYADLNDVSSANTLVTTEFSVDKAYSGTAEGIYVAAVGRQIGTNAYTARLVIQPNGGARLYILRNFVGLQAVLQVPNLTIVPGERYKLSVRVTGTGPTTVQAKVWKSTDAEPAAWQRTGTDTLAALQAPGGVGVFSYTPSATPNVPITVSYHSFLATAQ